jgi:hypothetical protein
VFISRPNSYKSMEERGSCSLCLHFYEICNKSTEVGWVNICGKNLEHPISQLKEITTLDRHYFIPIVTKIGVDNESICDEFSNNEDEPTIKIYHGEQI